MTLLRLSPKPRSTLVCSRSPVVTFLLHPLYLYVPLFTITTAREWVADGLVLITQLLYRSRLVKSLYIEVQVRYNLLFITNPQNILIKLPRDLMVTFQGFPSW